jgi:small-conductance mechanosensitive channel
MAPTRTPNQIAEQWANLGRCEEITMANDIKALAHLEDISNNLDEIRKELSSLSSAQLDIAKILKDIAQSLQEIAERTGTHD